MGKCIETTSKIGSIVASERLLALVTVVGVLEVRRIPYI